ncbi:MAG: Uma2 family endonuclease [Ktedonobacterales bacterium]
MIPGIRAQWAAVPPDGLMTVEELMALPEDRWRYELVAGRLVKRLPTDVLHDMIARVLVAALQTFARTSGAGGIVVMESGALVSAEGEPATIFVPALGYVRAEHISTEGSPSELPSVRVVPDLVVEIATPGMQRPEMAERARVWLAAGAQVVWAVLPAYRQVDIWRAGPDTAAPAPEMVTRSMHESIEADPALPGFNYPVAHLFS